MADTTLQTLITALLGAFSGATGAAIVAALANKKKRQVETTKTSAEALGLDIKNRVAIEDFYSGLLTSREDFAETIYAKLLRLEHDMMQLEASLRRQQEENARLKRLLAKNDIPPPQDTGRNGTK
jgi:hypothetical protein